MATANYFQYITAIQALSIGGVKRGYKEPPQKFNQADMPSSFVWFPTGDKQPLAFGGASQFKSRTVDLIVVYADANVTPDAPFEKTVEMMDAVEAALTTLVVGHSKPTWEIRMTLYQHTEELRYWAVIATVSGTG